MTMALDTAVRGILGLIIVAGMLGALWLAHAASARVIGPAQSQTTGDRNAVGKPQAPERARVGRGPLLPVSSTLNSARVARDPVMRTSIPPSEIRLPAPRTPAVRSGDNQSPPLAGDTAPVEGAEHYDTL